MIQEHKDERTYASWKLASRFYELSFTSQSGKLEGNKIWLGKKRESSPTSYAIGNSLGSIELIELEDLSEIISRAQDIISREGLDISEVGSDEDKEMAEAMIEELRDAGRI